MMPFILGVVVIFLWVSLAVIIGKAIRPYIPVCEYDTENVKFEAFMLGLIIPPAVIVAAILTHKFGMFLLSCLVGF